MQHEEDQDSDPSLKRVCDAKLKSPAFVRGENRLEIAQAQWDTVDDKKNTASAVGCDAARDAVMKHADIARCASDVARGKRPAHLLADPAKGAVGARFAVGRKLIALFYVAFPGADGEAQAPLFARYDEAPKLPAEVLDVFLDGKVSSPIVISVLHLSRSAPDSR